MTATETAYRTADPEVLAEWDKFKAAYDDTYDRRDALSEAVGRRIYVNRGDGYGSTRIVGFERFESDKDGDLVHHDGCLVVSSRRGQQNGLVVPNLRRKSGKKFAEELATYTNPALTIPGMATYHVCADVGLPRAGGPALFVHEGVTRRMYAFWQCGDAPVEDNWESIPLSTYYLAKEQFDAANKAEANDVSGNED